MKHIIKTLIVTSLFTLSAQASMSASCDTAYLAHIQSILAKVPGENRDSMLVEGGIAGGMTVGGVAGELAGVALTGATGSTGGLAVAGGLSVTSSVIKAKANKYRQALELIQEARMGDGLTLRAFVSELEVETSMAEVSALLVAMDKNGAQCKQKIMTIDDLGVVVTRTLILTRQHNQ